MVDTQSFHQSPHTHTSRRNSHIFKAPLHVLTPLKETEACREVRSPSDGRHPLAPGPTGKAMSWRVFWGGGDGKHDEQLVLPPASNRPGLPATHSPASGCQGPLHRGQPACLGSLGRALSPHRPGIAPLIITPNTVSK